MRFRLALISLFVMLGVMMWGCHVRDGEVFVYQNPDSTKWYYRRFWAPEVHKIQDKYYVTFNCRNENLGYTWQHIGYAVSNHIEGPYTVVTDDELLARGNDMALFEDDDNRVYTFWHNVSPVYGRIRAEICEKRGFVCDADFLSPFNAAGHNAVCISAYHRSPFFVIDPLVFTEDGSIEKIEPTYTPQIITW